MKRFHIRLVIGLMGFTLLGLTYIQYKRIDNIMVLRRELFKQHVAEALSAVCDQLEKRELSKNMQEQLLAFAEMPEYTTDTIISVSPKAKKRTVQKSGPPRYSKKQREGYPEAIPSYAQHLQEQIREVKDSRNENYLSAEELQRKIESAYAHLKHRMRSYNVDSLLETEAGKAILQDRFTIQIRASESSFGNPEAFSMTFSLSGNPFLLNQTLEKPIADSPSKGKRYIVKKKPLNTTPSGKVVFIPSAEEMMQEFYSERFFQPFSPGIRLLRENLLQDQVEKDIGGSGAFEKSAMQRLEKKEQDESVTEVKRVVKKKIKDRSKAIDDMFVKLIQNKKDIRERVNKPLLDSLLASRLRQKGIEEPFRYAVADREKNVIIGSEHDLVKASFSIDLFPGDPVPSGSKLAVYFPHRSGFVLHRDWPMFASSGALMLIVVFCFGYVVTSLFKQKKLSEIKNDFINNMTHEFKTPVSTISLVCEALQEKTVTEDKEKVSRLVKIVSDENKRLAEQVEKVLQTALIERDDYALKLSDVDINELLNECIDKISVQVQSKGGTIAFIPDVRNAVVRADRMHLMNVVMNLLDNANKYSPKSPQITLSAQSNEKILIIETKDQGMGMDKDMQRRIFDKFYRVPTGNRHDVKGFGLGLSYVKRIAELHGGSVHVKSELGKGSVFEVRIPLYLSAS